MSPLMWYNVDTKKGDGNMKRDIEQGTYEGMPTYCPTNAVECPYYKHGICHIDDPFQDCDDWCSCYDYEEGWEGWLEE